MEQTVNKTASKPKTDKPRAKISKDDTDTIIVLFMPDGRQIRFKWKPGHV